MTIDRLRAAYLKARDALLAERTSEGYWVGELSSSALSTATAVSALAIVAKTARPQSGGIAALIENGMHWLVAHQNEDGGWGDTVKSFSNISTTMLCRAAFHLTGTASEHAESLKCCESWLSERYGTTPEQLAEAVRQRYGKDRTFAVPILTMCALAGLVAWNEVPRLPYELACLPQSWYRFARLPVVSYALPALIAIGQCIHHHRGTWNPLTRTLRWLGRKQSLRVLERIQPSSGGYLEATPLTSFVVMSLASFSDDESAQRVIAKGVEFIVNSARPDGSWPIDTNLSVWVTTLSVNALAAAEDLDALDRREELLNWLLAQQGKERHPYTGAEPGGWGWSHLPGSVPDCDDTPGAMLAIRSLLGERAVRLIPTSLHQRNSIPGLHRQGSQSEYDPWPLMMVLGLGWVSSLQNGDGGWPTFCRGWGNLPFDRSGSDLTAHALRAWSAWTMKASDAKTSDYLYSMGGWRMRLPTHQSFHALARLGLVYLRHQQRPDGSWLPLWFGNQHASDDINPTYGTARVLAAYRDLNMLDAPEARRGVQFLLSIQNADGGWGGAKDTPSSIEETALAVEVLVAWREAASGSIARGLEYLVRRVEDGSFTEPTPIGFYFAKLWYFEKLYPLIFTVAALGRGLRVLEGAVPGNRLHTLL
jgi:squalene-hopene/tetraprenyl-beta-curcumene cyclase